jgi:carboxylesterase
LLGFGAQYSLKTSGTEAMYPPQKTPLIFLVHGFMGHPNEFDPLCCFLRANGFDTHTVCLPQHGDDPGNLGEIGWEDMLLRCQNDLKRCREQYTQIHLVGFSLGGAISMVLSREHPEDLQSLTLVAAPYKSVFNLTYGQYHLKYFFERFLPGTQYWYQRDTGNPKPVLYPMDLFRFYNEMEQLFDEVQQSVPVIQLPTLLIHSLYDITVPYEHCEWLYKRIPGEKKLVTLFNGGHQVFPFNVKGAVEESILQHINQVPAFSNA